MRVLSPSLFGLFQIIAQEFSELSDGLTILSVLVSLFAEIGTGEEIRLLALGEHWRILRAPGTC